MVYKVCPACEKPGSDSLGPTLDKNGPCTHAEVRLNFANGNCWVFPYKGLPHYVKHHNFQPQQEFVEGVMTVQLLGVDIVMTSAPTRIGFLVDLDQVPHGQVPGGFLDKLHALVAQVHSGKGSGYFRPTFG